MKPRILFISIILFGCGHFLAAQDTVTRDMIYKATVRILSDPSFDCRGDLYEVNDSSISISGKRMQDYYYVSSEPTRFPAGEVKNIQLHVPRNGRKEGWKEVASDIAYAFLVGVLEDDGF